MCMRYISFIVVSIFLSSGIYLTSQHIDQSFTSGNTEHLLYLPSGKFLQGAALCYDEMLADFMFIKTIGYFGGHAVTDQDYTWLDHMLNVVTTLDPLYEYPYEFGGIVLATEAEKIDSSISLLKKGMQNVLQTHKRYWYLPFFCAFHFMYSKNDYETAAQYLELSAKYKNSPEYLPLLAARLRANTKTPEAAIPFLQEMIKSTSSEELKKKLTLRINEVIIGKHLQVLKEAVKIYHSSHNKYPGNLEQLVKRGIISKMPEHPMGGSYYFSHQDLAVKSTIDVDDLQLHIDKKQSLQITPTLIK